MIRPSTLLLVADNSGALRVGCIAVPKLLSRVGPKPGNTLTVSVKKNIFKKNIKKKSRIITKSQILQALLVTFARGLRRVGNFKIKSSLNVVVLINQYELPYGTRLFGIIFREVRQKLKYKKIVSMTRKIY
jgi:large subunit ribosomal protein L14